MQEHDILGFTNKLLQEEVRPRINEFIRAGTTTGPWVVEFDPTSACNFQCPECISSSLLNKGQIRPARALELLREFHAAGVRGVVFIGGGEPLAHTGMPDPIICAHELGMSVGLTTNGSLIHRHLAALAECVNWTRVSIDAATGKTFTQFRPSRISDSFQKVISNVEQLAQVKTGILGYSFLVIERFESDGSVVTNSTEILAAASLAKHIGCDYFEFKPAVDERHHLIPLSAQTKANIREALDQLSALNSDSFRVVYPTSIEHLLAGTSPDQPKSYTTCPTLEFRTVVSPSGIYACPYKRGLDGARLGIVDTRFDLYWLSRDRQRKTRLINPSKDCPFFCIRHDSNILLHHLAEAYSKGLDLLPYILHRSDSPDVFL